MFSTTTIISIFTEIFAAGILGAGVFTFLISYFTRKKTKDLALFFVFLSLFFHVAATLVSQMMFNFGRDLSELIFIHKSIYTSLIICGFFIWVFIGERFFGRFFRFSYLLVGLLAGFLTYRVWETAVNLIYREGVVEPFVAFAQPVPAKPFFALCLGLLACFALAASWRRSGGERKLALYLAESAVIFLLALLGAFLYVRFASAAYLVLSWILVLVGSLGFLLAEVISPNSPEAQRPLQFLRTRILFKLMLIFVLLIVVLFEATTLATINIGKSALSRSIVGNYQWVAKGLAEKIAASPGRPDPTRLKKLVSATQMGSQSVAFIVDEQGRLVAHPDEKRALQHEEIMSNQAVKWLLAGKKGGGEFIDEIGARVVGAYRPVGKYGWSVVVEEPIASAYFELRRLEVNSLVFVIIGIVLTTLTGIFFVGSIEQPIKKLTTGTEAVARGDLRWQVAVDSSDELGRLAKAFNQMTKDLRDSQERLVLSEKLASLGTMAAGMAHEIKNPLVSIRTFTQLLNQKWEDKEFRDKFATLIPHEIERINRIAESLLKFGRPMKPEMSKVDINSLLDEVLLLFESECKKNNVRVTKKFASLPEITGDAGQMQQVFVNLIKNAIEAMQESGGEMVIKTDLGEVQNLGKMAREGRRAGEEMIWGEECEAAKPIPAVFIEISDTGEGISEEHLKSLFDPFFTTKMTGTGMGLPITLRIIEEHHGSIKVKSQVGKGTTFIVTLPQGGDTAVCLK
ncbi:HAMP domain-containing protein [Candidatus Saganbacteria bacterium]|nr:HAMP domain-containing protein [Candidatus Saganbacteria bacterium]